MFDKEKADRVKEFITRYCTHTAGEWAGKPFHLLPWQIELIDKAFGTIREDGTRQYRFVYCEIPKKNGKTELAGALALYGTCADGEGGAEVYLAASEREQAGLAFRAADTMVSNNERLTEKLYSLKGKKRILHAESNSFLQVLSAEAYSKHGLNPHIVGIDELHAHPNRELYDVLTSGTNFARSQQMVIILTTAGVYDPHSIWWEVRNHAIKVRDGVIKDDAFLPILYIADPHKDDPHDEALWVRVNPSVGHIFSLDKIRDDYNRVKDNAAEWNNFKRFRLNIPALSAVQWIDKDDWDKGAEPIDADELLGRDCYAGLDLSSTTDLTALVLVFPPKEMNGVYKLLCKFYIPGANVKQRVERDRVPYGEWIEQGHITATPGNAIDYNFIVHDLLVMGQKYNLKEVAFDRWGATKVINDLTAAGFEDESEFKGLLHERRYLVQFGQGYRSMSSPMKAMEAMIKAGRIQHGGNPVLTWCANNVIADVDAAEQMKPNKAKATDRIDGIVATIMGLARALVYENKPKPKPKITGV